ncbi:unnamed protein product [Ectocarpus sp. 12 AP-2014]
MGLWSFFLLERYVPEPSFAEFFDRVGILRGGSACDGCLRSGCCIFTEEHVKIFLCMAVPLPAAIFICWHLCCLPRDIARRRTQRAVERLRRFPGQRRWHAGGLAGHDAVASPKVLGKVQGLACQVVEARTLQQGQHRQ